MSVGQSIREGFQRALGSPGLILWLWLVNLVVALPAGLVMTEAIRSSIGPSLVHEKMTTGFHMGWFGEFRASASGLETTFTPTVLGAGAFYNNLEAWLYGDLFKGFRGLVGLGILYALLWALLLGGVLDRFARPGGLFALDSFFSAGGKYFFRFLRLAALSGVLYYLVYLFSGWLFRFIEDTTRDVTVERTLFLYTVLAAGLVVFLLTLVNMAFDYAKIATTLEERRSMILAALRGFGFVLSYPGKALGLYYSLGILSVMLLGVYTLVAPGAGQSTVLGVGLVFLLGQLFLIARLVLRLAFFGGQMALYAAATSPAAFRRASEISETGGL